MTAGEDTLGGVAEASRARRLASLGLDVMAAFGGRGVLHWARRLPNGDRLSPGQLALGLTVLHNETNHRVVLAADADSPRRTPNPPSRNPGPEQLATR